MAERRARCAEAGLDDVSTYLHTGNVLFESGLAAEDDATAIEDALVQRGLRNAPAVVRSLEHLDATIAGNPFAAFPAETHSRYVTLFRETLPPDVVAGANRQFHVVAVQQREILTAAPLERPQGLDINGWLSKQVRSEGTTRYFHVVEEVARLLRG